MHMRKERDSMGEIEIPATAQYGAQTQRAVNNFTLARAEKMPRPVLWALIDIKACAAKANCAAGKLDSEREQAICAAVKQVQQYSPAEFARQFPVPMLQTGSGTSSNMNANEVLANLATKLTGKLSVHPNDHLNMGQSSNDVIPAAIQASLLRRLHGCLYPAIDLLVDELREKSVAHMASIKNGRTHLMDAMPVTFGFELKNWAAQLAAAKARIVALEPELACLPIGGTAVGTGVNTHPGFAAQVCKGLSALDNYHYSAANQPGLYMGAQEHHLALAGALKSLAVAVLKLCNDLRWMNSGPVNGLGEISLPVLQPGSSIMPAKVNPVIPEAVAMAMAKVMGHETTVAIAAQSGNFQLNVMLPVIADALHASIGLLADSCESLVNKALRGLVFQKEHCAALVAKNAMLVTGLNERVGYGKAAEIAKRAQDEARPLIDVASEETSLSRSELERLLDPMKLAAPFDSQS